MFHLDDDKFISFKNIEKLHNIRPADQIAHDRRLALQGRYLLSTQHALVYDFECVGFTILRLICI